MKRYLGINLINARPMTWAAYNALRGWKMPADENGDDAGYLVEDINCGRANHPEYAGYISWSRADVFDRAYRPVMGATFDDDLAALKAGLETACKDRLAPVSGAHGG